MTGEDDYNRPHEGLPGDLPGGLPVFEPGWVWLAGAGPGDPGLLTLHALNGLRQADVVVFDALVDQSILAWVKPGAVTDYAGKRGGKPSPKQRDITLKLIDYAREGKRVLRLKGGDPFVFGRGGEEALGLVEAGVPFRIIPGITAGIGGLAYGGIPATHRDCNQAVTFLTGHDQTGLTPDAINWDGIAKGSPVIVMYMAMKHLDVIAGKLIAGGRSVDEPGGIGCNASLAGQDVLETTLGRCAEEAKAAGIEPPAVVCVGEVVRLRKGLDWLDALSGKVLDSDPLGLRISSRSADAG
ncbi:MAG: uroporphyrinogen-III C-methyltransferase [Pseudomonadota bacterium]|nr:uroporphyrinogen-III C-methyltransferase [Pseudomonadota bacterium]